MQLFSHSLLCRRECAIIDKFTPKGDSMSRNVILNIIVALVLLGVGAAGGALIFSQVIGGSGEPSQPISAPTLSLDTTAEPQATSISDLAGASAALDQIATGVADPSAGEDAAYPTIQAQIAGLNAAVNANAAPAENTSTDATQEPASDAIADAAAGTRSLFRIVPEESEVRFILSEMLRGVPTTVVGQTDQVAGDIIVDFAQPSNSQVGTIRINARTLLTDNEFRNRAIRGEILESARDEYEFAEFNPTVLEGLPESVTVGEEFSFNITGDLTVRNITQSVTFLATITPVSETRIEGTARTTVQRSQYNLTIPSAPGVADVSEEVALEIDLVATLVES
jgi:polyisoprenoid-binding protein YceI